MNKRKLYESIMREVSREVKKALNENIDSDSEMLIDAARTVISIICDYANVLPDEFETREYTQYDSELEKGRAYWVLDQLVEDGFDTSNVVAIMPNINHPSSPFNIGGVTPLYILRNADTGQFFAMTYTDLTMTSNFLSCLTNNDDEWMYSSDVRTFAQKNERGRYEDDGLYLIDVDDFDAFCEKYVDEI